MLSRFDAISHIMPYYGQTHKAFLLLAGLCSETRCKLDEFYDEFIAHMKENWTNIIAFSANQQTHKFLPNDLFVYCDQCTTEKVTDRFIEFIESLRDSKGWYFNSHYMHSQIKIRDSILAEINFIKTLYPYVDVLKSTQVTLCIKDTHSSKVLFESSTLNTNKTILYLCSININFILNSIWSLRLE